MRAVLLCKLPARIFSWQHKVRREVTQVVTENKWLTIREAANYIGMSVGFLRKAVRLQRVPHTRIGSKALRFDRDALDAWVTAQSCRGGVDDGPGR